MKNFGLYAAKKRFFIIAGCLLICLVVVLMRLFYLQIIDGQQLAAKMHEQLNSVRTVKHPRGRIVDRDGEEMAVSVITGSLFADPEDMGKERYDYEPKKGEPPRDTRRLCADLLAPVLKRNADELYKLFNSGGRYVMLER